MSPSEFQLSRRQFVAVAAAAGTTLAFPRTSPAAAETGDASRIKIQPFDFQGVHLGDSRWGKQFQSARDFYLNVSNDDILCGYRRSAGLSAPGQPLGGWCATNSNTVFGQWLSGMSRMYRATGDDAIRDKAVLLAHEWAKAVGADGNSRMGHYPFEKLVCGLVDLKLYAGCDDLSPMLEKVTESASKSLDRTREPAAPRPAELHSGRPLEWYTVGENLFRAFQATGNEMYKDFAQVWLYPAYWNKFAKTSEPPDAWGVHAYSHVNTFSSAAMAYAVLGDQTYLDIIKNAYDFLQNTQCFATGGFGPVERIMPAGNLGKALEMQMNTCEAPCCSWAGFKLAKYLMKFTGEARYGDWIERLVYNGIGAALPITGNGKHFYYADYRVAGGVKYYARSTYTCCSGTYIQAVTDYHDLIYFKDADSLYVNLYLPSEVKWSHSGGDVKLVQETTYPEAETSTLTVSAASPAKFALKFRVPGWSNGMTIKVNGGDAGAEIKPGTWAVVNRQWQSGDKIEVRIPLRLRYQPVDEAHPNRVAIVRGPVVLVQDAAVHEAIHALPANDEELNKWLVTTDRRGDPPAVFRMKPPDGVTVGALFQPFYAMPEVNSYRMYFDRDKLPYILW
jgi:hypothetical protein